MSTTESELVQLAQQGDQEAFRRLVEDNQRRVYSLCLRLTGSPEDGQDLAQETFLRAWRGLSSFKGEASFATWVYRLASNACLDFLRRQKRRQGVDGGPSMDDPEGGFHQLTDSRQDPARQAEGRELKQAVEEGLKALPPNHRQVLVMREVHGLSYQEIAYTLEVDLGTVKSRIARARVALKKYLQENGNFL